MQRVRCGQVPNTHISKMLRLRDMLLSKTQLQFTLSTQDTKPAKQHLLMLAQTTYTPLTASNKELQPLILPHCCIYAPHLRTCTQEAITQQNYIPAAHPPKGLCTSKSAGLQQVAAYSLRTYCQQRVKHPHEPEGKHDPP